jgi:hypothetical protein
MLDRFFQHHHDCWAQYSNKAELIYESEHYVLIRTGMSESRSRYVWMADKAGLLAPGENDSPLAQLAGSLVHPVQVQRARNDAEILHDSDQKESEGEFKGRWCKARLAQCIAYVKESDYIYDVQLPEWIEEFEKALEEQKALEAEERCWAAQLVRDTRRVVGPVGKVRKASSWDTGPFGTRKVEYANGSVLSFEADTNDWRVAVWTRRDELSLTRSQLVRLTTLLREFAEEDAK